MEESQNNTSQSSVCMDIIQSVMNSGQRADGLDLLLPIVPIGGVFLRTVVPRVGRVSVLSYNSS